MADDTTSKVYAILSGAASGIGAVLIPTAIVMAILYYRRPKPAPAEAQPKQKGGKKGKADDSEEEEEEEAEEGEEEDEEFTAVNPLRARSNSKGKKGDDAETPSKRKKGALDVVVLEKWFLL